ncbi:MAG: lysophospholipid acyltransferase family protein [Gammaproteobacteria bacterium]|nr:lysophospholipid acyltransferase family protein [Gammaproteobacteria bacterium]MCW9003992.1 lysophospholipid acyltransferase family protein [Gammaproteobacteria bacterium]MCW9055700.1 lysophospholipid acyltransferase family protein [Gammaproteobacteria bacterium]
MKIQLLKFVLKLTSYMPLKLAHWMGIFIGRIYQFKSSKMKHIAMVNIQRCFPELDTKQQHKLLQDTLLETGKLISETGIIWSRPASSVLALVKSVNGKELITNSIQQNKGVLLAMPHIGSWELVALYCAKHFPMTTLYRPPNLKEFDEKIRQARERTGATLVPTDNTGVRALSKALKNSQLVGMLPDQEPGSGNGLFAPFFNIPAYTMSLLPRMATKFNCQVIYAYAERLPQGKGFNIVFRESKNNFSGLSTQTAAELLNNEIEELVRELPAQYQWIYKRFKTRPENEASFY